MLYRLSLALLLTACFTFSANAQTFDKKEFLKEAAEYVCDCFEEKEGGELAPDMAVGFCMITYLQDNPVKAKMAFGDYELTDVEAMTRIGEELGVAMAGVCPTILIKLAGEEEAATAAETADESQMVGKLLSVDFGEKTIITLQKENGQVVKFYWLEYFQGADVMAGPNQPKGQNVVISYRSVDIFSGTDKEYYTRRVVTGLKVE